MDNLEKGFSLKAFKAFRPSYGLTQQGFAGALRDKMMVIKGQNDGQKHPIKGQNDGQKGLCFFCPIL